MMSVAAEEQGDTVAMLMDLAAAEGTAAHPYTHSFELNAAPVATRNLADALHLLSMLHCVPPGLVELAAERNILSQADTWYAAAADGFAAERQFLTRLIVIAGPVPSTPGEAETMAAMHNQRHALDTIALSDRFGCPIGAVVALLLDWQAVRAVLEMAAERMGLPAPASTLPDERATSTLLAHLPTEIPRLDRTLAFGARQFLIQHRCLWDLLEARASAREAMI